MAGSLLHLRGPCPAALTLHRVRTHASCAHFGAEPTVEFGHDSLMEYREIVSNVLTTPAGAEAWLEMDAAGHLTKRCAGCGLDEYVVAMAPGLAWLAGHAVTCVVRRA